KNRETMKANYENLGKLRRELNDIHKNVRDRLNRIDFLSFQLQELDQAQLKPGEEEELTREVDRLKNAEQINKADSASLDLCYERDNSAAEQIAAACAALDRVAPYHEQLKSLGERLNEVRILVDEVSHDLRSFHSDLNADPAEIDASIERLELIKKLRRKH